MNETIQFLIEHGYIVIFVWVLAEQLGIPLPAVPILLAAGALAGKGRLNFSLIIALAFIASMISDLIWYQIGRRRGVKVLKFLCKVSLEPDHCVRSAEDTFAKYGLRSLLVAKFIPGLNTVTPPLAGIVGMRLINFIIFDGLGVIIWAGSFILLGYLFSNQLELVAEKVVKLGSILAMILGAILAGYIGLKYNHRRRVMKELYIARITSAQLKQKLDNNEEVVIVDLRHTVDFETNPHTIPGAIRMTSDELEQRNHELPRDRDIILYCT